jgi:hypothetical protein
MGILGRIPEHMTLLLTLFGIVLYGGSVVGLNAFYQALGTTADEVGVSYLSIITTAGISLVTNVILYGGLAMLIAGLMHIVASGWIKILRRVRKNKSTLDYWQEQGIKHHQFRNMLIFASFFVAFVFLYRWMNFIPPRMPKWTGWFILLFLVIGPISWSVAYAVGMTRPVHDAPSPPDDIGRSTFRHLRDQFGTLTIVVIFILAGSAFISAGEVGEEYAARVKAGQTVQSSAYSAVSLQAFCVILLFIDDASTSGSATAPKTASTTAPQAAPTTAPTPLHGRKLLYLGQSGGVAVLYQVDVGTIRVPSESFVIRTASDPCRD